MNTSPFRREIAESEDFLVTVELLTTPADGVDSYVEFFQAFADRYEHRAGSPKIVAVTSPHSPGGMATLDPFNVWAESAGALPEGLDAIAHVACKDMNRNGLETHLRNLRSVGVGNILALTGDHPINSAPVFDLDSLGLLQLAMEVNGRFIKFEEPEGLDGVFQFSAGAGMSPYKYTLASAWQQYAKMLKKVTAGASFLITQVGYDIVMSADLIRYARAHDMQAATFGNVYLLTKGAATKMHAGDLPGCYASDELMTAVEREWRTSARGREAALTRMAHQTALFEAQGYRGAHLGGWGLTYDDVIEVLDRAREISDAGVDPEAMREWCHFAPPGAEYFIGEDGEFILPSETPKRTPLQKRLEFFHDHVVDVDSRLGAAIAKAAAKDPDREGIRARALYGAERAAKALLVECKDCGDCRLPDNYYALCNEAACAKGLPNLPCGDSDSVTGMCGNADVTCAGELVFYAAFARGKLGELAEQVQSSKVPSLRGSSAVINYLSGHDHNARIAGEVRREKTLPITVVGESVHAQIPRVNWSMASLGTDPGAQMNGPLAYVHDVIVTQINAGADYLAINVDDFGPESRADMMRFYVDMVNTIGRGVPVCIDSSDPDTKAAGIDQYFRTARDPQTLPMLNSINMVHPKAVLELRERYPFKVVAMLHETVDKDGVPVAIESPDQAHGLAVDMFEMLGSAGFEADDIFFDTAVTPIAADLEAKRAHQTMHGIRAIANDPGLEGARTLIGLSNCSHMMPNRRAVNRAYLHVALEHGVTAAVLDPTVNYGEREPGKQILSIMRSLADNDGSDMTAGFEIFTKIADYSRRYGRK